MQRRHRNGVLALADDGAKQSRQLRARTLLSSLLLSPPAPRNLTSTLQHGQSYQRYVPPLAPVFAILNSQVPSSSATLLSKPCW